MDVEGGALRQISGRSEHIVRWLARLPQVDDEAIMAAAQVGGQTSRISVWRRDEGWRLEVYVPRTREQVRRDRQDTRCASIEDDPLAQCLLGQAIDEGRATACDEVMEALGRGREGAGGNVVPPFQTAGQRHLPPITDDSNGGTPRHEGEQE
jgi:hypothetical protein